MESAGATTGGAGRAKAKPDAVKSQPSLGAVFCAERLRLAEAFLDAARQVIAIQVRQMQAVKHGDSNFARFDRPLHEAQARKEVAKYAWMAHVESHNCEKD